MYLTEAQLSLLLNDAYFTLPATDSAVTYAVYRGHVNATVHTIRFNITTTFSEEFMIEHTISYLMSQIPFNTKVLGAINYDLLLKDPNSTLPSYYIWRANSNARSFDAQNELLFTLTYDNIYRFIFNAHQIHIPDLNINFRSSNVVVNKPLAIVFSFVVL